jgi:DNA replication protein DnaC
VTLDDLVYARIGKRYWYCTRAAIPDALKYKKILCEYINKLEEHYVNGLGLLLFGPYSAGKTGAGVIILKAFLSVGRTCLFLAARDVCHAKINNVIFDDDSDMTLIDRAETVNCLLLDDLGDEPESKSDYVPATIEGLVRTRSDNKKVTVITTNLSREGLREKYGDSFVAVLNGCVIPVGVVGYNWREKEAGKLINSLKGQ